MQWTDRIRQVKIILVLAAIIIAVASLIVSNNLVKKLADEEHNKMEVWAEAMRSLNKADENTDLNLVLKVINENNTIPVIVTDSKRNVQIYRNVDLKGVNFEDSMKNAEAISSKLLDEGRYIRIYLDDSLKTDYINVCYDDSVILKRLSTYPYIQLGVVMLFVVVAIFALLTSKKAEQNKVWVGLSKETAHQLGTPISSLMAWTEILKENYPEDELIPEMDKDVKRLELIAERFSKIGSLPEPVPSSLMDVMTHVIDYMDRRTSSKVKFIKDFPDNDIIVKINSSLFEWVIENLCKNAVDAMEGCGTITLHVEETASKVIIEVTDTGKGIKKKNIRNVFKPGFTTKKRGWGLGLSLAKRIVEEYHKGRIFVKNSEIGKGTTFRIELTKRA
ncbi:HAMP domain-containing sensor histidine kinase [uncultured Prevotella sp.]|uniref:sensor histidine kinase n=1 Tax=uncultured Prevotella sp. TaxID=159272 RepID=UPI0025ECA9C7|nr:HAMP domain-containing sensor histidine kinase [uncultured Prevotella sp.]